MFHWQTTTPFWFNIKANGKKLTDIARSKIAFLGHEVGPEHYRPGERNVQAIIEFPRPNSSRDIKSFLGMANFFRKFVKDFAKVAGPLYELTTAKAQFKWGTDQEEADRIKNIITSRPCLGYPRDDRDFVLHTDGSGTAAALFQSMEHGDNTKNLVVIGYFSKALASSQQKWAPTHIELSAIIAALRFFKATIYKHHTKIFCDHKPLTFLLKQKTTHDHLARWVVELQGYDVSIHHIKGTSNVVADCLSRASTTVRFADDFPEIDDTVEFPRFLALSAAQQAHEIVVYGGEPTKVKPHDLKTEQKKDPFCRGIYDILTQAVTPNELSPNEQDRMLKIAMACNVKNGCIFYEDQPDPAGRV